MRTHPDDFLPFAATEDGGVMSPGQDANRAPSPGRFRMCHHCHRCHRCCDRPEDFERYCTEMETTSSWGGELEVAGLPLLPRVALDCFPVPLLHLHLCFRAATASSWPWQKYMPAQSR
jgi:hypothetical protein